MSDNPNADSNSAEQIETMDLATAQRVEREKMTRRSALRKFGFGAGLAAFSMLGVDDFARMVGKRMERMAGDNKVAEQVAKEFQQAGIASALPTNPSGTPTDPRCQGCVDAKTAGLLACAQALGYCEDGEVADRKNYPTAATDPCSISLGLCQQGVACNYAACCKQYSCNC